MIRLVWDIEVYPNCFTLAAELVDAPFKWAFEISEYCDDSYELRSWCQWLIQQRAEMVGFNSLGFDYPVLHALLKQTRKVTALELYEFAMRIIVAEDRDKFQFMIFPSDRFIPQIDLFKIHHFDNKARATSLKVLEFNMRSDSIVDLPFPVGTHLTPDQIVVLKAYNAHDVAQTKQFYHHSTDMIRFREELTAKYQRDFMNHNDTKIGKDYFIMMLEQSGIACYQYGTNGRTPRQTPRPQIILQDAILPQIQFSHLEFNRVLTWIKSQVLTQTKGAFDDIVASVNGFDFVFGTGGIHGSITNEIVESDGENIIIDLDVRSYYPNLAIVNRFFPAHLGERFCDIYKNLYEMRTNFKKGTAENAMLKLALNGVFGDSNSPFSVFYDPLYTMSITLNGQLLLCMLAESLMAITGLRILQINTDGLTVSINRNAKYLVDEVAKKWQEFTGLQLEEAVYSRMCIRDVNNYTARYENGDVKRKGAYEYELDWHQNHGALVVPKVAEQVLIYGKPIRETVLNHPDKMDFMLRTKVPRSSLLLIDGDVQVQNVTRYYIAKNGVKLTKLMPPLKGKTEWRRIGVESGWTVEICNRIDDAKLPIDYDYYIHEVEKLCLGLM